MPQTHYGRNALVLGPLPRRGDTDARHELLEATDPRLLNVVEITYSQSPWAVYDSWCERLGHSPRRLFVVSLDSQRRRFEREMQSLPPGVVALSVTPYDLTELGMRWQRCLRLLDRAEGDVVVELDSITSMLQFANVRTVYRFLHMVTGQVREIGASAQFHVDPAAHEERTIHLLQTTMDEVRQQTFGRHLQQLDADPLFAEDRTPPTPHTAPGTTRSSSDPRPPNVGD